MAKLTPEDIDNVKDQLSPKKQKFLVTPKKSTNSDIFTGMCTIPLRNRKTSILFKLFWSIGKYGKLPDFISRACMKLIPTSGNEVQRRKSID